MISVSSAHWVIFNVHVGPFRWPRECIGPFVFILLFNRNADSWWRILRTANKLNTLSVAQNVAGDAETKWKCLLHFPSNQMWVKKVARERTWHAHLRQQACVPGSSHRSPEIARAIGERTHWNRDECDISIKSRSFQASMNIYGNQYWCSRAAFHFLPPHIHII